MKKEKVERALDRYELTKELAGAVITIGATSMAVLLLWFWQESLVKAVIMGGSGLMLSFLIYAFLKLKQKRLKKELLVFLENAPLHKRKVSKVVPIKKQGEKYCCNLIFENGTEEIKMCSVVPMSLREILVEEKEIPTSFALFEEFATLTPETVLFYPKKQMEDFAPVESKETKKTNS